MADRHAEEEARLRDRFERGDDGGGVRHSERARSVCERGASVRSAAGGDRGGSVALASRHEPPQVAEVALTVDGSDRAAAQSRTRRLLKPLTVCAILPRAPRRPASKPSTPSAAPDQRAVPRVHASCRCRNPAALGESTREECAKAASRTAPRASASSLATTTAARSATSRDPPVHRRARRRARPSTHCDGVLANLVRTCATTTRRRRRSRSDLAADGKWRKLSPGRHALCVLTARGGDRSPSACAATAINAPTAAASSSR